MKALHVDAQGEGALPLVCLHGWGMNSRVFDPLRAALDGMPTVAVDLPGHGRSPWRMPFADFDAQAEALFAVLPERSVLLGWSMGAQFAMQLALQAPQRVAGLVLVAATPRFEAGAGWALGLDPQALSTFRETLAQDWEQTLEDFIWLQLRGSRDAEATGARIHAALQSQGAPSKAALAAGLDILAQRDLRAKVAQIAHPALVICGQNDRVTPPAAARWLAAQLPEGRYLEIARAGHAPFLSHVAECAGAVRGFFDACLQDSP